MGLAVLHNTPSVGKASFGLGQVALNLARAQNEMGCNATIWCQDNEGDVRWAAQSVGIAVNQIISYPSIAIGSFAYSQAMISSAKRNPRGFDIVHQHGVWTACSMASNVFRRRHGTPVVIAPHGSLQKWALKRSVAKKKLAMLLYESSNLHHASCLHATAEAEIRDFRDFGLKNPIAIIPNGVSEDWLNSQGIGQRFIEHWNLPNDRRILLFLSRITPKKGLPMLLRALDGVRDHFADWLLIIAGKDEFGHKEEVEALLGKLALHDTVRVLGPMYGQLKRDAFAAAEVLVLPSYSEGSPMIILDSLAVGVPVMTTKGAPWECLEVFQSGWWVDVSTDGMIQALRSMLALNPEQLKAMGQRGKELVKLQYLWPAQAMKTIDLYEWLLGRKERPDFVNTD